MTSKIASYVNGDTEVEIFSDGTKVRTLPHVGNGNPLFPESMDVKITNYCDRKPLCAWCHENSSTKGTHGDVSRLVDLLSPLPAGVEIAIGGGHPLSHPQFDDLVATLSGKGIICNVTINEYHFAKELELDRIKRLVSQGHIHGVGYSYETTPCDWDYDNLVTHVILGITPWEAIPEITRTNKKILLLGYKFDTGRGKKFYGVHSKETLDNIAQWKRALPRLLNMGIHISMDNNAIRQLDPRRLFPDDAEYVKFYMGDDGTFTMYADMVTGTFGVSSTSTDRFDLADMSIYDCFSHVRMQK